MSDLYFHEESDNSEENASETETFAQPFFNHFFLILNRKNRVVTRDIRKKLKIFTLQLPIYYISE